MLEFIIYVAVAAIIFTLVPVILMVGFWVIVFLASIIAEFSSGGRSRRNGPSV